MTATAPSQPVSGWKDSILWSMALFSLAVLFLYLVPLPDAETATTILDLWSLVPFGVLGVVAPWVGLPPMENGRERAFWGLWSAGLVAFLAARIVYLVNPEADFTASGALTVDLLYGAFYLSLVIAVTVRPDRPESVSADRRLTILETAGTVVFTLSLLAYLVLLTRSYTPEVYDSWIPSLTFYWVLDLLLLFALLYLLGSSPSPRWKMLYAWLALAPLSFSITDGLEILYYHLQARGVPSGEAWMVPTALDFLWYLPWVAIILASRMRGAPWPAFLGRHGAEMGEPDITRSLGRPGWLLLTGLAMALVHFAADLSGLLGPAATTIRTLLALSSTTVLVLMALIHQRLLAVRMVDLTRRSREIEEHQRFLATAVEGSSDGILIADAQRSVRYANPAWRRGIHDLGEAEGSSMLDCLPRGTVASGDVGVEEALSLGVAWDGKYRYSASDGSEREEIVSISPALSQDGEVTQWVAVRNDITYLAQLERRLGQTQKMEALGTLAGGIAHDFNNLLGAIYGYGELLGMDLDPDASSRKDLQGLLTAAERAAELVSQILTFSRQGEERRGVFLLETVIEEALSLLRATTPSTIAIQGDLEASDCRVRGSRQQIHQMILNLGTNAAQAMSERGGTLEVRLETLEMSEPEALARGLKTGGTFARITVRDTGVGMDRNVMDRIFDPFFTTKEVGKGTGLGLSVVHGAVSAHGGSIQVESEPGSGSMFQIHLPCCREGISPELDDHVPPPRGSGQNILVVDDEPTLVAVSGQILEGLGYRTERFTESSEALEWFAQGPDRVDGILTDQTMPGLTGLELSRRARELRPGLPVLLMTGYSELLSREALQRAGASRVIMKPFNRRELGNAVATALTGESDPGSAGPEGSEGLPGTQCYR